MTDRARVFCSGCGKKITGYIYVQRRCKSCASNSLGKLVDDAYEAELVRVYGERACKMRYRQKSFKDQVLVASAKLKCATDELYWLKHVGYRTISKETVDD